MSSYLACQLKTLPRANLHSKKNINNLETGVLEWVASLYQSKQIILISDESYLK